VVASSSQRERHVEAGQLAQVARQHAIDRVAVDDPTDRERCAYRHGDQLKCVFVEHADGARLAVGARLGDQLLQLEAPGRSARLQGIGNHVALEIDVQHRLGLDARALVLERRGQRGDVAGRRRLAKRKIGGRGAGCLRLALGILPQHAREHLLADA